MEYDLDRAVGILATQTEWDYRGRNFCTPKWNTISLVTDSTALESFEIYAPASKIFENLGLSLTKLSQIFVKEPHTYYTIPTEQRTRQPRARSYDKLGACRAWDEEGWMDLAKLTGRSLRFWHGHGDPMDNFLRAIYHPDGTIERPSGEIIDDQLVTLVKLDSGETSIQPITLDPDYFAH